MDNNWFEKAYNKLWNNRIRPFSIEYDYIKIPAIEIGTTRHKKRDYIISAYSIPSTYIFEDEDGTRYLCNFFVASGDSAHYVFPRYPGMCARYKVKLYYSCIGDVYYFVHGGQHICIYWKDIPIYKTMQNSTSYHFQVGTSNPKYRFEVSFINALKEYQHFRNHYTLNYARMNKNGLLLAEFYENKGYYTNEF